MWTTVHIVVHQRSPALQCANLKRSKQCLEKIVEALHTVEDVLVVNHIICYVGVEPVALPDRTTDCACLQLRTNIIIVTKSKLLGEGPVLYFFTA